MSCRNDQRIHRFAGRQSTGDQSSNVSEQYERISSERRIREIDFEIKGKQRRIDGNIDRMNQDVAELRKQLAALVYVGHGSSEENTKRNKALIQRNALAQQSLYVKLQAIATKYQTENTALDKQITQLHDERSKLESRLSKLGLVAKNPDSTSEYYEQIVKERRFREIDSEIENKTNRINDNIDRMNREMAELQKQAEEIGDSPLNAFARQSLHISMQAIASKYQMENTALNEHIAQLRAEKSRLDSRTTEADPDLEMNPALSPV